ncbi:MAG: rRNA maturation RNase YbeY [Legionellales bacterium]|nr:rRNA maturation RNase YbeY [Legionellales bacterium]
MMENNITIINEHNLFIPNQANIIEWLEKSLIHTQNKANITLKTFTEYDMQLLNNKFRKLNKPTNILAFPYEPINRVLQGDLAICPDIIIKEAKQQSKNIESHFAHIIIHGLLHIVGYTHENDHNATIMEKTEAEILSFFNITDPYIKEKKCL